MNTNIQSLDKLIHELCRLPGIGEKSATRLAFFILQKRDSYPFALSTALTEVAEQVHHCPTCYSYTDQELCHICQSPHRQNASICVVEQSTDVYKLEAAGIFKGQYHVLGGSLSPIYGVQADDLKIKELIARIDQANQQDCPVRELILALDADLEGDTTALYIAKLLEGRDIRVSRLAYGLPMGSDIDYIDSRTLGKAFENRINV